MYHDEALSIWHPLLGIIAMTCACTAVRDVVSVLTSRSQDCLETQFQTSRSRLGLGPQGLVYKSTNIYIVTDFLKYV